MKKNSFFSFAKEVFYDMLVWLCGKYNIGSNGFNKGIHNFAFWIKAQKVLLKPCFVSMVKIESLTSSFKGQFNVQYFLLALVAHYLAI